MKKAISNENIGADSRWTGSPDSIGRLNRSMQPRAVHWNNFLFCLVFGGVAKGQREKIVDWRATGQQKANKAEAASIAGKLLEELLLIQVPSERE